MNEAWQAAQSVARRVKTQCESMRDSLRSLRGQSSLRRNSTWGRLGMEGVHLQRQASRTVGQLEHLGGFLMLLDAPPRYREFVKCMDAIDFVVRQENDEMAIRLYGPECFDLADVALARVEELFQQAHSTPGTGWPCLVPDTNVLIDLASGESESGSPINWSGLKGGWSALSSWVVPPVVRELDVLKGRADKGLRASAQRVIRELERLSQTSAVHQVGDGITLIFALPELRRVELESLPWFDGSRGDHHILAAVLDVARRNPQDDVYLVTGDLHMKLLARHLGIAVWSARAE